MKIARLCGHRDPRTGAWIQPGGPNWSVPAWGCSHGGAIGRIPARGCSRVTAASPANFMHHLVRLAWYKRGSVSFMFRTGSGPTTTRRFDAMARSSGQPQPDLPHEPDSITDPVEISFWLGTYRERRRLALS